MARLQLGRHLEEEEVNTITSLHKTLTGEQPASSCLYCSSITTQLILCLLPRSNRSLEW